MKINRHITRRRFNQPCDGIISTAYEIIRKERGDITDIYIKPVKNARIVGADRVRVGDVCEISAPDGVRARVEDIPLRALDEREKALILIPCMDVVTAVNERFPDLTVHCVSASDTVVEYRRTEKKPSTVWGWVKTCALCLIFVMGASSAIMSFHNDAEIPKVLSAYWKMFTGKEDASPRAAQVPYAAGLALGIIVFFNHFAGKSLTGDPSPLEIEVTKYKSMISDTRAEKLKGQ